jgi:hypothetical protein
MKANGIPRRPRQIEYYPGEFEIEPDPLLSCKSTTGTLVRRMVLAGWSTEQIEAALSRRRNAGGQYYRWRCLTDGDSGDAFLSAFIRGSELPPAVLGGEPPYMTVPLGTGMTMDHQARPWRTTESRFVVRWDDAITLLRFIAGGTRTKTELVERGPLSRRVASTVLHELELAGLVTVSDERVNRHAWRQARVVRLADQDSAGSS